MPSDVSRCAFVFLLFACGMPNRASAQFEAHTWEARRTATPPTIDGRLDDAAWATAQPVGPFYAYQSGGDPALAETTLRLLWDDQNLYVAMEGADADIRSSCELAGHCEHDSDLYEGDVLELFLRESTEEALYHEFEWNPLGADFDARFDRRKASPGRPWESGLESAVTVEGTVDDPSDTDTGWRAEARIPLAAIAKGPVVVGAEWTFAGARYDYANRRSPEGPALMMSSPGDPSAPLAGMGKGFHSYEIYDVLRFAPAEGAEAKPSER